MTASANTFCIIWPAKANITALSAPQKSPHKDEKSFMLPSKSSQQRRLMLQADVDKQTQQINEQITELPP
jgi:hypothetical protein